MPSPGDQWCNSGHPNGGTAANIVLDATAVALTLAGAPEAILFLVGQLTLLPLITSEFCATGAVYPGDPLASDLTDMQDPSKWGAIRDKYIGLVLYYAWPQYCTCDVFTPPDVSRPPPPPWPTGLAMPPAVCTPFDITSQFNALNGQLAALWTLVSLIAMRTGALPYVHGPSHVVSGDGSISVLDDIGVLVSAATFAPGTGEDEGDPIRLYPDTWLTFGNSDGWEPRMPLLHLGQIFLGLTPGFSTLGYSCGRATSLTIVELLPSPSA